MQSLPTEIVMLGIGVVLLIVQLFLQSVSSAFEVGGEYKAGQRDDTRACAGSFRRPRRPRVSQSAGDVPGVRGASIGA